MKIGIVQCAASTGDLARNINMHVDYTRKIVEHGANIIMFPELSLTGYEPALAENLATDKNDPIFQALEDLATDTNVTICAGMPLRSDIGITISMLIFGPANIREVYSKQFLHDDEIPFFVAAPFQATTLETLKISTAICYEIAVPAHVNAAATRNANIYLSSVVKYPGAMKTAYEQLSDIASRYKMLVLMSNAVGLSEGVICGGLSAIWNEEGKLLAQLNHREEGALIIDTETRKVNTLLFD